jgi:preprotein translocase subunit SecG
MGILGTVLLVVFIIVSILLILMVIIQDEGDDSLGGIFAGAGSTAFGARSSNVVVRFTYVLGALFFITAFSLALVNKTSGGNVEAAAQKKSAATTTEWWNAPAAQPAQAVPEGTSSLPAAPSAAGTTVPATAPSSAPSTAPTTAVPPAGH